MFVGDERAEHDKSGQITSLRRDLMDAFEASREQFAPVGARSEAGDSFVERRLVDTGRKIASFGEFR